MLERKTSCRCEQKANDDPSLRDCSRHPARIFAASSASSAVVRPTLTMASVAAVSTCGAFLAGAAGRGPNWNARASTTRGEDGAPAGLWRSHLKGARASAEAIPVVAAQGHSRPCPIHRNANALDPSTEGECACMVQFRCLPAPSSRKPRGRYGKILKRSCRRSSAAYPRCSRCRAVGHDFGSDKSMSDSLGMLEEALEGIARNLATGAIRVTGD